MKSNNSEKQEEDKYRIFDDIYGLVKFNETEKRIIDSPIFQRLRRIKQLGLAHLVFPGAMHTRFSHSIGTLAIAQRVAQALKLQYVDGGKLRMAALLHDVGHFPLSHTIEKVYSDERKAYIKKVQEGKIQFNQSHQESKRIPIVYESVNLHEEMSAKIIKDTDFDGGITRILKEDGLNAPEIANIVIGQHPEIMFNQLMHSEIDIDQMDYLIRDSKNAGITYGTCDIDYIISNMIKKVYNEREVIFFDLKALRAIEHFFMARHFYFTQILYHKTRSVIEKSAYEVYKAAIDTGCEIRGKPIHKYLELMDLYKLPEFLDFDDSYFDCVAKEVINNVPNKNINKYANVIIYRKVPELHYERFKTYKKPKNLTDASSSDQRENDHAAFLIQEGDNEIPIIESFDILANFGQIKKRTDLIDDETERLYGDREAVRLQISNKYDYNPKEVFLCQFDDTILSKLVNYKFEIYRKYRFKE